ncbi:cell wall hydrolase [Desulfosporosinus sp. BG]|uniref:cell wall hydrolase n=1 Tax=Desulfosporosinus sp. BG TaxID=1633135 RepID=UPI00083ADCD4|nr:cell wall hydrolase [Desulfosporosinus sp. BG]
MCLFLWQASIYPALGRGSKIGTVLSYNIAMEETKKVNYVNDNALENPTGTLEIVVQRGESLWNLAQRYHTTVDEIAKLNQIKSPDQIRAGEPLLVPNGDTRQSTKDSVTIDVKDYPEEVANTASGTIDNTVTRSWWKNILQSIPVFAGIYKQGLSTSRSNDPQPSQMESKIPTYDIVANQETQSVDQDDAQTQVARNTVPIEAESQVLSRGLGRLVSKEDVELLSRVIYGEARGENFEGQVAVGAVVLNRLKDPRFPKSIRAIIYQSGAFTAVEDRQIHLEPDDEAYKAAEAALSGMDPTNGAIFYFNPRIATDRWIKSRPVIKRIGNHTFSI